MRRFTASGILIGIVIGIILNFINPSILEKELLANLKTREQLHKTSSRINKPIARSFDVGYVYPVLGSIVGGSLEQFYIKQEKDLRNNLLFNHMSEKSIRL